MGYKYIILSLIICCICIFSTGCNIKGFLEHIIKKPVIPIITTINTEETTTTNILITSTEIISTVTLETEPSMETTVISVEPNEADYSTFYEETSVSVVSNSDNTTYNSLLQNTDIDKRNGYGNLN